MPEFYRFFDETADDPREYTADDFAEYFRVILADGILNGGANLNVLSNNTMVLQVQDGYAWIQGYMYKVKDGLNITIDTSDPLLDRIDRVVVRLDRTLEQRNIKARVLKGTPSDNPIAPELTRDDNIFEISLAQVRVIAGKSFIDSSQITDERLDDAVCGLVNSLITLDTSKLAEEWDTFMADLAGRSYVEYNQVEQMTYDKAGRYDVRENLGTLYGLNYLEGRGTKVFQIETDQLDGYGYLKPTFGNLKEWGTVNFYNTLNGGSIDTSLFKPSTTPTNISVNTQSIQVDQSPASNKLSFPFFVDNSPEVRHATTLTYSIRAKCYSTSYASEQVDVTVRRSKDGLPYGDPIARSVIPSGAITSASTSGAFYTFDIPLMMALIPGEKLFIEFKAYSGSIYAVTLASNSSYPIQTTDCQIVNNDLTYSGKYPYLSVSAKIMDKIVDVADGQIINEITDDEIVLVCGLHRSLITDPSPTIENINISAKNKDDSLWLDNGFDVELISLGAYSNDGTTNSVKVCNFFMSSGGLFTMKGQIRATTTGNVPSVKMYANGTFIGSFRGDSTHTRAQDFEINTAIPIGVGTLIEVQLDAKTYLYGSTKVTGNQTTTPPEIKTY